MVKKQPEPIAKKAAETRMSTGDPMAQWARLMVRTSPQVKKLPEKINRMQTITVIEQLDQNGCNSEGNMDFLRN